MYHFYNWIIWGTILQEDITMDNGYYITFKTNDKSLFSKNNSEHSKWFDYLGTGLVFREIMKKYQYNFQVLTKIVIQ